MIRRLECKKYLYVIIFMFQIYFISYLHCFFLHSQVENQALRTERDALLQASVQIGNTLGGNQQLREHQQGAIAMEEEEVPTAPALQDTNNQQQALEGNTSP